MGPYQSWVGAHNSIFRGEITPVAHLFSAIYSVPITPFIISIGVHLVWIPTPQRNSQLRTTRNAGVGLGNFLAGIILNLFAMPGYTGSKRVSCLGPFLFGRQGWHRHQETSWRMKNVRDMLDIFLDCMIYDMIICLLLQLDHCYSYSTTWYIHICNYIHLSWSIQQKQPLSPLTGPGRRSGFGELGENEFRTSSSLWTHWLLCHSAESNPFGFTHQLAFHWLFWCCWCCCYCRCRCLVCFCIFRRWLWDGGYTLGCQEQIRAQLIMARYLKIHIIHPLKSKHLDILTQTHTTFFDPLVEILRLELIADHSGELQFFFFFYFSK